MTTPDEVRDALQQLPELATLLPTALITRVPTSTQTRSTPASKPPAKLEAIALLDERTKHNGPMSWCDPERVGVLPYLFGWCRELEADALDYASTPPPQLPPNTTVNNCCAYLLELLDFATQRPQWEEFAQGIIYTHRRVKTATIGVRDDDPTRPIICNHCGQGQLRQQGAQRLWQCDACGREISIQAVTLRQAAPIIGIPLRTLQRWAWRNLLEGVEENGHSLYDLGDIRRVAAEIRLRQTAL